MSSFALDTNIIDILIAAYCKTHGYTLATNNTRHFENIPGLVLCAASDFYFFTGLRAALPVLRHVKN
jgi:hypothetical protein